MKKQVGYVYLDGQSALTVKKRAVFLFACLLAVPAVFVVYMFVASGFWEVFLVAAILTLACDVLFVLANGLSYAARYSYAVTGETIRVRKGICCNKLAVFRFADVDRVRVKRYYRKKKVGADVQVYEGEGKSALRFLSDSDAVYDIRLYCGSGKHDLKFLPRTAAAAVLSYFEDLYDERKLA